MTSSIDISHFIGAGLALCLGLLVGIQRGWAMRGMADGTRFAGIRTYGLLGLAGGIAGALYSHAPAPALILLAATAGLIVFGYSRTSKGEGQVSGTASIVGLLTVASGFVAATGEQLLGTAIAVAMVVLLSLRGTLHEWVRSLSEKEVMAIARFAVIALVILPLLPDEGYGPYGAWHPRQLWMVVVLVSGFSFAGYFATKRLGPSRGNIATAAAGAVVSSTAVTAAMAAKMRNGDGSPALLSAAICMASVVMYLRVLVLVGALASFALAHFALLVVPGLLVSLAATAWHLRRAVHENQPAPSIELGLRNPFDLGPALLLAALVMALTVAAHWVLDAFGDQGVALVLAISGIVDVDSAIITMGHLPPGTLQTAIAGLVLAIPVTLNTLFKGVITISVARPGRGMPAALPLFASAAATVTAWFLFF